jgi:hypothetical protein
LEIVVYAGQKLRVFVEVQDHLQDIFDALDAQHGFYGGVHPAEHVH